MTDAVSTGTSEVADAAAAQATTDSATVGSNANSGENYDVSTNPAWQPVLDKLPGPYQELIKPHFAEWDKNFQKVQESYNPWKQFAEAGVTPDAVMESLQLRQLASSEQGIRQIYDNIVEQFGQQWGLTPQQAQQAIQQATQQGNNPQGQPELDLGLEDIDPRYVPVEKYEELKKNLEIVGNYLASGEAQKQQAEQQAKIDAEIDSEVEQLKNKYGPALTEKNLHMIYQLAAGSQDNSLIPAAEALFGAIGTQAQSVSRVPTIMAPGGGTPSNAVDVTSLNREDTKKTALAMLKALQSQGD